VYEVKVRKKVVDATFLEGQVPASSPPPFEVAPEASCIPVGELANDADRPAGYVIIGAGKTALDACTWLLDSGVPPGDLRWIKPREACFLNRIYAQSGELVGVCLEGVSLQVEAAAQATSTSDLYQRLAAAKQLLTVDERETPTMFRGATLSVAEVEQLRKIEGVVRLGKVRRIERDRIVLERGSIPTSPRHIHVHCAAQGLKSAPAVPIFSADRIVLQSIRIGQLPFASALIAFIEATRDDLATQNRLCPPNPQPHVFLDWLRGTIISLRAGYLWSKEPDIAEWLEQARLNVMRGILQRAEDPRVQEAFMRFTTHVRPALANLERLIAGTPGAAA